MGTESAIGRNYYEEGEMRKFTDYRHFIKAGVMDTLVELPDGRFYDLQDLIDAALSTIPRPIDSAPREQPYILGIDPVRAENGWSPICAFTWVPDNNGDWDTGQWVSAIDDEYLTIPTHWFPLPKIDGLQEVKQ